MNHDNKDPHHHAASNVIAAQIETFMAGLEAAGYAANTLCTKRAALRRFATWRQRLKNRTAEPDKSEVAKFMATACRLRPKRRCLASTALSAFLQHLRRCNVIATWAQKAPETAGLALERRYADFLRDEKVPGALCALEHRRLNGF